MYQSIDWHGAKLSPWSALGQVTLTHVAMCMPVQRPGISGGSAWSVAHDDDAMG